MANNEVIVRVVVTVQGVDQSFTVMRKGDGRSTALTVARRLQATLLEGNGKEMVWIYWPARY